MINRERSVQLLSKFGSLCSVIGLFAVLGLKRFPLTNMTLVFWWLTAAIIGIAAFDACFTDPAFGVRLLFCILFAVQLPAFDRAWGEIVEQDTHYDLRAGKFIPDSDAQLKIDELEADKARLERDNAELRREQRDSLNFWKGIAHLAGICFALLGCTAAGQRRLKIVEEGAP